MFTDTVTCGGCGVGVKSVCCIASVTEFIETDLLFEGAKVSGEANAADTGFCWSMLPIMFCCTALNHYCEELVLVAYGKALLPKAMLTDLT